MIRRRDFLGAAGALALAGAGLPLTSGASRAASRIQRVISPGGIEAWFVQDATVPLIAMEYAFAGGAAQDPAARTGLSHMVAETLDEGAGDLDSSTFHDRLERRAIQLSFATGRDYFRGSLRMLKANRDEAFGLLRLALTAPRFDTEAVERVRSQVISALRRETTTPNSLASRSFWQMAYADHPYGRPTNGTLETTPAITPDDLRTYVRRTLTRDGLRIAVVGDVDAQTLGRLLDETFGGLPAAGTLTQVPAIAAAKPPQRQMIALDVPQTVITFGGPGLLRSDPDFMAAYVVNHILGGGSSSRLYREVREKRGLAYSIYDSLLWMQNSAVFAGSTATRADRAEETLETLASEIQRLGAEGPTETELAEAKSYLKGSQMLALDTSSKIAAALVQYQLDRLPIDYIDIRNGLVDAVTLADAQRAARRVWGNGLLAVVVGRPAQATAQTSAPNAAAPPQPVRN